MGDREEAAITIQKHARMLPLRRAYSEARTQVSALWPACASEQQALLARRQVLLSRLKVIRRMIAERTSAVLNEF
jgi:hypothetical protein